MLYVCMIASYWSITKSTCKRTTSRGPFSPVIIVYFWCRPSFFRSSSKSHSFINCMGVIATHNRLKFGTWASNVVVECRIQRKVNHSADGVPRPGSPRERVLMYWSAYARQDWRGFPIIVTDLSSVHVTCTTYINDIGGSRCVHDRISHGVFECECGVSSDERGPPD